MSAGDLGFAWPRGGSFYGQDGAPMVAVPAGPFMMGSGPAEKSADADERPAHRVTLKAFYIDRFEVTEAQYRRFLAETRGSHRLCERNEPPSKEHTPSRETWTETDRGTAQMPVVGVDWFDAFSYCAWAGKRLPSEAEWEKAARGTEEWTYPWGDRFEKGRANSWEQGRKLRLPVGTFESGASPFGAEDMAGNVWEWVSDWYAPKWYLDSPKEDPAGPASGSFRAVRGGSCLSDLRGVRTTVRDGNDPAGRYSNFGFRCAQTQGRS
jgi:formylglycine-generating enzyme required for sulfatase activity